MKSFKVVLQILPENDHFIVRDYETMEVLDYFKNISNIELHLVTITNSYVTGTYIEPETLEIYEKYIDKTVYPKYIDFYTACVKKTSSDKQINTRHDMYCCGNLDHKFKSKTFKFNKAFFQIRKGFNQEKSSVVILETT